MISSLEDFKTYNLAMEIGEEVWRIVDRWGYFEKDTVGKQFVKAVDSIGANLSEGLGRYHYRERKNFAYYSRGSLFESKTWLIKSMNRNLITQDESGSVSRKLEIVGKMINGYINSIGNADEPFAPYNTEGELQTPIPNS